MKPARIMINRNICDNAPECSGIAECPAGALYWDDVNEVIAYNEDVCLDCGNCVKACPVGAILWGRDEKEQEENYLRIESDPHKIEELVVERYGAMPIEEPLSEEQTKDFLEKKHTRYAILEYFSDDSIRCLLHSIRISDILSWLPCDVAYAKVQTENNEYLPILRIFDGEEMIGEIIGYYDDSEEQTADLRQQLTRFIPN